MVYTDISSSADIIDSRDILQRISELESLIGDMQEEDEADSPDLSEEKEELRLLKALQEECETCTSEFEYGTPLIRESHWVEYCEEMCRDIGDMPRDIPWYIEIDWEATADNIACDYSTVDYDGITYYVKSC